MDPWSISLPPLIAGTTSAQHPRAEEAWQRGGKKCRLRPRPTSGFPRGTWPAFKGPLPSPARRSGRGDPLSPPQARASPPFRQPLLAARPLTTKAAGRSAREDYRATGLSFASARWSVSLSSAAAAAAAAMWVPWTGSARLLLLLLASVCRGLSSGSQELRYPPKRIAVIGAGIGGTSASYFLRQKFGKDVLIDVFERGDVGGRLATVNLEGEDYEAGGSAIHPLNLHMKHFVEKLGLSAPKRQGGLMGIYNGDEFVFEESSWYIWNFVKLLWHYGLNPLRMSMWVEEILDKFMRIYRYQAHDYAFSSSEGLLHALGGVELLQMLNQTIDESMQKSGFSHKFINEIVTGVMREDFGQGANINGFVGTLSLAGADTGLWSVGGGNKRVCTGLLHASKAQLIPGTVISIEEKTRQNGRSGGTVKLYEVTYNSTSGLARDAYNIILIATPLNRKMANIAFLNFNPPIPEFSNPYQETVATFVHGHINASFFGYQDPSYFHLNHIVTIENPKLFINSMVTVYPVKERKDVLLGPRVWKIFSPQPLTKEQMNLLFVSYDTTTVKTWLAYPHYSPPEKCPPIILHSRMYYLNSIECLASAMEMSAISAKNAALLAYHHWYENMDMIDQEDLHEKLKTEL